MKGCSATEKINIIHLFIHIHFSSTSSLPNISHIFLYGYRFKNLLLKIKHKNILRSGSHMPHVSKKKVDTLQTKILFCAFNNFPENDLKLSSLSTIFPGKILPVNNAKSFKQFFSCAQKSIFFIHKVSH